MLDCNTAYCGCQISQVERISVESNGQTTFVIFVHFTILLRDSCESLPRQLQRLNDHLIIGDGSVRERVASRLRLRRVCINRLVLQTTARYCRDTEWISRV